MMSLAIGADERKKRMNKMDKLSREQLEHLTEALSNILIDALDSQTVEFLLKANGIDSEELEAIGFDMED